MAAKTAGLGAAIVVLMAAVGFMFMVGVILVMMWFQPGIARSPSGYLCPGPMDTIWTSSLQLPPELSLMPASCKLRSVV